MQRLEVSGAVRPIYESLGVKRLISCGILKQFYAENTGSPLTKTLPLPSCKY